MKLLFLFLLHVVKSKMFNIPFAIVSGVHSLHITGRSGGSGKEQIVCYSVK